MAFFSEPILVDSPFDTSSIQVGKHRMVIDTLYSFQRIKIDLTTELPDTLKSHSRISIPVNIYNPYTHQANFNRPGRNARVAAVFMMDKKKYISTTHPEIPLDILSPGASRAYVLHVDVPDLPPGSYQFGLGIQTDLLPPAFNSKFSKVCVTP